MGFNRNVGRRKTVVQSNTAPVDTSGIWVDNTADTPTPKFYDAQTDTWVKMETNAESVDIINQYGNFIATNVEGALNELFTSASNGKINIATAITGKGINADSSDTFTQLATKITQLSTGTKNTKLNVVAPYTKTVALTNPIDILDVCTSVIQYVEGSQGQVQYTCNFNNGDSTNFTSDSTVTFDGKMYLATKTVNSNFTTGSVDTGFLYEVDIDKSQFYTLDALTVTIGSPSSVSMQGTNNPVFVTANNDIDLTGVEDIAQIIWTANATNTSKVLLVISIDSGLTWNTWNTSSSTWDTVDTSILNNIKLQGMSISNVNGLTLEQVKLLRGNSNKIRFGYYIEQNNKDDVAENDSIILKVNMLGTNQIASSSVYSYSFGEDKQSIIYNFTQNGTYTITWVD